MRFLFAVILIAILSAAAEYFLPWWSIAVVAFGISFLMRLGYGKSFLAGFSGVGLCWLAVALWHDTLNDHILAKRMTLLFAQLFFHSSNYGLFIFFTVLTGALVGGMAAWAGANPRLKRRRRI